MSRLSVRTKLLLLLLLPLVLFAATATYLLQLNAGNVNRLTSLLYETTYTAADLVVNADRDMYQSLTAYQGIRLAASGEDEAAARKDFSDNAAQKGSRRRRTF